MSSGFPGDLFSGTMNSDHQFSFRAPVSGSLPDPAAQIRRQDWIGKRSLAEFQQQNQGFGFYLRNMKPRNGNNYYRQHASPKSTLYPVDFPYGSPEISAVNPRYGRGIGMVAGNSGPEVSARDQMAMMSDKLQELEKQLLDDDDDGDGEPVSAVTNSEWSDTIQDLIGPARKPISLSPASSSSSCSSTSASPPLPCAKQSLIDAAEAISDGKPDSAADLLTRLQQQVANSKGTPEQRLALYMVAALKPRVSHTHQTTAAELSEKEHEESTQMLFDASPCFKLCFMAANMAILEAMAEQGFENVHVVDFDVGQGRQYVHLLHALSAKAKNLGIPSLTITAFVDTLDSGAGEEKLKIVGDGLQALAERVGVCLTFNVKNPNTNDLTRGNLQIRPGEALAVNFSFKLYNLPDESVTTENIRDLTLRRVKSLSPEVMTVVEQEMNTNTAPLCARVKDAWEYYRLLFDSLDSTMSRDNPDRFKIEEGLGRKIGNAVGCEGPDRVERCEFFGKWRARLSMAGFEPRPVSKIIVDSLRVKVNSVTRGNPGFSVNEESGGIGFGWMGRNLTVASAWR